jgi:2-keto-4-pentenoate hydratase/2-oxohepta-3-ene-1,7-dioic acid hydratase (catechol pathway)
MTDGNFRLGRFQLGDQVVIGRLEGNEIGVVWEGDQLASVFASELATSNPVRSVSIHEAVMLPPVDPAARVFAVAINYRAHGVESSAKPPERPLIFYKAPSNFVGHGCNLNPNKTVTSKLDYEGEIAVVIGRTCKAVSASDALDYVAGVCAFNDGSARDLVKVSAGSDYWPDWTAAKGLDGASALGPTITCGQGVIDSLRRRALTVTTRLNDEIVQMGDMSEMIFSTEQIIATLSSYMTLLPGDVIATGTPSGVGATRNRFLNTGDELEIEVGGLDPLHVKVG